RGQPYFGFELIKLFQSPFRGIKSSKPVAGRALGALRGFIILYLLTWLFVLSVAWYRSEILTRERTDAALNFAKNDNTSDYRLRLLLLAVALRQSSGWREMFHQDIIAKLEDTVRDTLLRAPVFAGSFVAAAWDAAGKRIITQKSNESDLIVHDLLNDKDGPPTKQGGDVEEDDLSAPRFIGFLSLKDGNEKLVVFRSASGTVWAGDEGSQLTKRFAIPGSFVGANDGIQEADIFSDHVRAIILQFDNGAISRMSVAELAGPLTSGVAPEALKEQNLEWNPVKKLAPRQPVLSEDCDDFAYLGRSQDNQPGDGFTLWLGRIGKNTATP